MGIEKAAEFLYIEENESDMSTPIQKQSNCTHTWNEYKIKIIVTISCNKLLQ